MTSAAVSWGVIGTAKIAREKVIPAMRDCRLSRVDAIASREAGGARAVADRLGIPKAYGSYEELLADPAIEAVYNPLPNHLHVPWTIRALEAGKHVLCEKPIALNAREAEYLIAARERTGKLVAEAFMVRQHPQWQRLRDLAQGGRIGEVRAMTVSFAYNLTDPANVRNQAEIGGGGLMDIGCYAVATARYMFGAEPLQVSCAIDRDPVFGTDRLTSGVLTFPGGRHLTFVCSTQLAPMQRATVLGTKGHMEIRVPFNPDPAVPGRLTIDDGSDLSGAKAVAEPIPIANAYTLQADAFSRAVRGEGTLEFPIEDAIANMRVIDALFRAAETGVAQACG